MNQAMGSAPTTPQPTSEGNITVEQMQKIMNGGNPNQDAAALGHSNGMIGNLMTNLKAAPGQIGNFAGTMANDALRFGQSAINAPGDIISGLEGKGPDTSTLPNLTGEGQQTFQGEFASKTIPAVVAGTESPLAATAKTTGGILGGALNFLGFGAGGKAAAEVAPKVVKEATTAAKSAKESMGVKLSTSRLSASADIMTKKELEVPGRVAPSGKVIPSATEIRAGEIMKGKTYANPVKTQAAIKNEIASRGTEAEDYLGKSGVKISNKEDYDAFQSVKSNAETYMTPTETKIYDEQVGVFQKILKNVIGDSGYTTASYYKALKDFETNVTANIPKGTEALRIEGGAAKLQASKDVRSVVRDMIGRKNPEFKGKMFDLASLYDSLDNVSARVAGKAKGSTTWSGRNPIKTKIGLGVGAIVGDKILKDTTGFGI